MPELNVVTGGLSYIGKHITKRLISNGKKVLILTGHPNRPNPSGNQVEISPFHFENQSMLTKCLYGTSTLYNTYWVRFSYGNISFEKAIENTRRLISAAQEAGVQKIVHISVSNPSEASPFPYFQGKAVLEKTISQSKIPYAIIRPTLVYGGEEEILINNIAWLLRHFPIFAIPKPTGYRFQPIFVDDLADLAINAAQSVHNQIIDAAGPNIFTFEDMVRLVAGKIGSRCLFFKLSPAISLFLLRILGVLVNDVVLTEDELGALMANLLVSKNPPEGRTRFSDWLDHKADLLGRRYASELNRHYR
jgi:NADH dehydrogenase